MAIKVQKDKDKDLEKVIKEHKEIKEKEVAPFVCTAARGF